MSLELLDAIDDVSPERIVARLGLSANAPFLADHFPGLPVLPGVLVLEAFVQAAGWLAHHRRGFARSIVALREARHLRFGRFVSPGDQVTLTAVWTGDRGETLGFDATAEVRGQRVASAKLELAYYDLSARQPELAQVDARTQAHNRERWDRLIARPSPSLPA